MALTRHMHVVHRLRPVFGGDSKLIHKSIDVLVVTGCVQDAAYVRALGSCCDWNVRVAPTVHAGAAAVADFPFSVVLSAAVLPDGDWRDLFHATIKQARAPLLIVASRHADDRLWAEVLNYGGTDVLQQPFNELELLRAVVQAWRRWCNHRSYG